MRYPSAGSLIIFIGVLFLLAPGILADENVNSKQNISDIAVDTNYPGLFEVRIVSPEMLETIGYNYGSNAVPLKVERGLYIGLLTPGILYLRGDLSTDDFPVHDVEKDQTEEKIEEHLLDITFGRDNAKTALFAKSPEYLIWFDAMYEQSDIQDIQKSIELINDLSQTTTFEDEEIALPSYQPNYLPVPYLYYKISFIDKDFFKEKLDDRDSATEQILKDKTGKPVALVRKDHIYLLNDVTGDERNHLLQRSILYSMGFHGESNYPDSFFNPDNYDQIELSDLDKKAIQLMYGGRLQSGMDVDTVKKSLGIESKD